ncbi:MFS general substrate transporter [Mollisia scopiformis]|uniref:MFS general substrate transporter n=1 Tax=Mollisia scopiformis TaxID=149040 RepID=A0A132B6J9_MOLSC|nr:MFS general substrate transporter [Mollisia scopiformis]KUJ08030.1 MFS general substrate transporter [Mollisia scopiformis]
MTDLIRDTVFGHFVRLIPGIKLLRYPDELNPSLGRQAIEEEGSDETEKISNGEEVKSVHLVAWYGSDDPESPQNWSSNTKLLVTAQICVLNFSVYVGSAIYTPGEESIMKDFGVSTTTATLGLSLFVLGYGLGPMLFSPMSEMPQIGRSGIYFWTLFMFVILQLPVGFAPNISVFLAFRFFTGFFGGPVLATGGATIADMYPPTMISYGICIWGAFGILGPVLGPLVGGFAAQAKGWKWTIWELTWLCSVVLVVLFFLMPETNPDNILYRRARRLRKATGDKRLKSQSEIDAAEHTWRDHLIGLGKAFTLTFFEPVVFFVGLYTALLYGVLYIWFESFPLVFGNIYGFNTGEQGLAFLGIFVGGVLTLPCYLLWIKYSFVPEFSKPVFVPEKILPPAFFGAFALPICLFMYGWTARESVHWIVPIIGSGIFTIAIICLFNPVLNYLGMAYPTYAASVYAGNTLFRASFGVIFPLFARALFHKLGIAGGNSLLGGLSILFIPIPFVLYKYGKPIRHASKNARHDI